MAVTATILASGRVFGGLSGPLEVALSWAITNGVGQKSRATLTAGDNSVFIPLLTTMVIVVPPTNNTQALLWKGAGGDTGTPMAKTTPSIASWDRAVSSTLILNLGAGGGVTVDILFL